jgi:hypothetical protein
MLDFRKIELGCTQYLQYFCKDKTKKRLFFMVLFLFSEKNSVNQKAFSNNRFGRRILFSIKNEKVIIEELKNFVSCGLN